MTQGASKLLAYPDISPLDEERSSGTWLKLIDGLFYPTRVFYTATEYPTTYCVLEILSNILYHIEHSSDHTRGSAGYPAS